MKTILEFRNNEAAKRMEELSKFSPIKSGLSFADLKLLDESQYQLIYNDLKSQYDKYIREEKAKRKEQERLYHLKNERLRIISSQGFTFNYHDIVFGPTFEERKVSLGHLSEEQFEKLLKELREKQKQLDEERRIREEQERIEKVKLLLSQVSVSICETVGPKETEVTIQVNFQNELGHKENFDSLKEIINSKLHYFWFGEE